jgi:hypothetical protein
MKTALNYCTLFVLVLAGLPASVSADLFEISFEGKKFDGSGTDTVFQLKEGSLFLRESDWVFIDNLFGIKPLNVNAPVVTEATFDVLIGGETKKVTGVRLTNIRIGMLELEPKWHTITVSESKVFADPVKFGGVLLGDNWVHYYARDYGGKAHETTIKNTGFIDTTNLGTVEQTNSATGTGDYPLFRRPTSTGKEIDPPLPAGAHKIRSELTFKMDPSSELILRDSGEAGVAVVPEPCSMTIVCSGLLTGLIGLRRGRAR